MDAAVDAIIAIDTQGFIKEFNAAAALLFGYAPEKVIGANVNILMPEPFRGEHDGYIGNYLATERPKIIGIGREVVGKKKSGEEFPMYLSVGEVRGGGERTFIGIIHDLTTMKQAEAEIKDLSYKIVEIQEEERNRISKEIHDDLGTSLLFLKMTIQATAAKLEKRGQLNLELSTDVNEIIDSLGSIVESARQMSHNLSPVGLRELALSFAIDKLADQLEAGKKVTVIRDYKVLDVYFPKDWDINIYRIVQETLNNVSKHSEAAEVTIDCRADADKLILTIADNGRGVDLDDEKKTLHRGLGLSLMKERARYLNGDLTVQTARGEGFTVVIEMAVGR